MGRATVRPASRPASRSVLTVVGSDVSIGARLLPIPRLPIPTGRVRSMRLMGANNGPWVSPRQPGFERAGFSPGEFGAGRNSTLGRVRLRSPDSGRLPDLVLDTADSPRPRMARGFSTTAPQGNSSTGRASVSKTEGWGFKSLLPCEPDDRRRTAKDCSRGEGRAGSGRGDPVGRLDGGYAAAGTGQRDDARESAATSVDDSADAELGTGGPGDESSATKSSRSTTRPRWKGPPSGSQTPSSGDDDELVDEPTDAELAALTEGSDATAKAGAGRRQRRHRSCRRRPRAGRRRCSDPWLGGQGEGREAEDREKGPRDPEAGCPRRSTSDRARSRSSGSRSASSARWSIRPGSSCQLLRRRAGLRAVHHRVRERARPGLRLGDLQGVQLTTTQSGTGDIRRARERFTRRPARRDGGRRAGDLGD